ncbi:hypothetical protein C5167_050308 [Papaver somniferum]|uniref:Uncharacterized protein n=1 Tax=Papaver somniferum TaxID=3469 RepID=A0A4Y7KPR4_PAPSO|nr:hypothetical protein C5167_050308 [Papaver somniferum]
MGERSVNGQSMIRMALPMSIRCDACRKPMYIGFKLKARRDVLIGETTMEGIQIYRFSFNCNKCSAE